MDQVAMAAGSALVGAMATDAWQQVRDAMADLWRRVRSEPEPIGDDLGELRAQLRAAAHDPATVRALEGAWQLRLQALLREHPEAAGELRQLLDDLLAPALGADRRAQVYAVFQTSTVHGGINVNVGRDLHGDPRGPKA
ncbi:hypothetical protein [Streptomyces sp. G45]|uniref:hypothetical protein n=1 Tax=Streptomyces sp. G45 TaxID=3406627 RepID=UPI003C1B8676